MKILTYSKASKKKFQLEFYLKYFYLCVKIRKLNFSKVIVLKYFCTIKYRAAEKNNFLQQEVWPFKG